MDPNTPQTVDVILNHWATLIQISILSVLVIVFIALWKNFPRRVVFSWMTAWCINLGALSFIYLVLINTDKASSFGLKAIYLGYGICKIWFAILLTHGMSRYLNQQELLSPKMMKIILTVTVLVYLSALLSPMNTLHIQIIVYSLVGIIFSFGAIYFLIRKNSYKGLTLQLVILAEGCLFLHHAWVLYPTIWGGEVPRYMTRISFFDSISELIVGLTCLFAIAYRLVEEFRQSTQSMEAAQQELRQLVDNDALTGLWNRRRLKSFVKDKNNHVSLIFIDINNFKTINDTWGHSIGDLCLIRVATAMRQVVDNFAGIFRLGGDEFLAVIPNNTETNPQIFVKQLRWELSKSNRKTPPITFSYGIETMTGEDLFEEALDRADQQMYLAKQNK